MLDKFQQLINTASGLFNSDGNAIMALDIGLSAVKVAEIKPKQNRSKYTLLSYASVPLPEGAIIEDEIQKPEEIVNAIKQAISQANIKVSGCCFALAGPNTFVKKLSLAGGSDEEIEDQVMWESEQYLPFESEGASIDFHVVGENEGGGVDVIVAATKNDVVNNFKEIVDKSGLKAKIVDLGVLAVTNVFELVMKEKLKEPSQSFLILDIGAQKTFFVIYKNYMIVFAKEINMGGVNITEEIQRRMGINYYEAEDLKITGDENGNLPEEILEIIDEIVVLFFSEVKKTLDFYISSTSDESLAGCCVTGGGGLMPGILEGLEALIGVDVSILNPFDKIEYNKKSFSEKEISEIVYKGASAIGLAMRAP